MEEAVVVALAVLVVVAVVVVVVFPSRAASGAVVVVVAVAAVASSFQKLEHQIQPLAVAGEEAAEAVGGAKTSVKAEQRQVEASGPSPQLHLRSLRTWCWASVGRRSFAHTFATDWMLPASSRRDFRGVPAARRRCPSRRPRNRSSS